MFASINYDLCESCYFALPESVVKRTFTDALVPLKTAVPHSLPDGFDAPIIPVCDGCGQACVREDVPEAVAYIMPFFACQSCARPERSLLRKLLIRLPWPSEVDCTAGRPLFFPVSAAQLEMPDSIPVGQRIGQWACDACAAYIAAGEKVYVIDYAICKACRLNPTPAVQCHFRGMFRRVDEDFKPPATQIYEELPDGMIGKGGQGVVWAVRVKGTNRVYARKQIPVDNREDALAEASMLTTCCHPNIGESVEAYHYCMPGGKGTFNIVMERADHDLGHLIDQRRRDNQPLSASMLWQFFKDLANGLGYMHDRETSHRDIKPGNCLVFDSGGKATLKLSDLGFSKKLRLGDTHTSVAGSPWYVAPELVDYVMNSESGALPSPYPADIWALGVVFYFLTYGQHPYVEERRRYGDFRKALYNLPPEPPHSSRSAAMWPLISSMLCREPARRPTIAAVLQTVRQQYERHHPQLRGNSLVLV